MNIRYLLHLIVLTSISALPINTLADTLKIGTDSWPPFREIKNNQVTGIDEDL